MNRIKKLLAKARENIVPYHNTCQDQYFFGNSIVGASGLPDGTWTFVIGPDYTCPNFISSEKLYILCSGTRIDFDLQMKRIRKTGIFFGESEQNGFRLSVFDFAPPEKPLLIRLLAVEDLTLQNRSFNLCADIVPYETSEEIYGNKICIKKDTDCFCFGNKETLNWENRYCEIQFCGSGSIQTLIHWNSYEHQLSSNSSMDVFTPENTLLLLEETFSWWEDWFSKGNLPRILNQRDADAVESLLLSAKMQQNRDGGTIAGIGKYANSYVRDIHGCSRLYNASGHYEESRKVILNIHSRWEKAGFIPNWWSMGSDTFIGHSFHNDAAEVTAYYLFMVRDYLQATGDPSLLRLIRPSLDYAANTQLEWLLTHDHTMDFNGDETEQYCCNQDGEEYGGFIKPGYEWDASALSFPSMVAALGSLEWYQTMTGTDLTADLSRLRNRIDEIFCDASHGNVHAWAAKKTDNGYQLHAGQLTNYLLFPLWINARLNDGKERSDAAAVKAFVRDDGFLPNCPQAMQGFCGHTMGMFLDTMLKLDDRTTADKAARQILDSPLLSMYGTVWEFYGPSCVPNGHRCRGFEGGITGQALIQYFRE